MKKLIYKMIWNMSEFTGIGLGRFAPTVFGGMLGSKPSKIYSSKEALINDQEREWDKIRWLVARLTKDLEKGGGISDARCHTTYLLDNLEGVNSFGPNGGYLPHPVKKETK